MPHETFFDLLGDAAHWEFEVFVTLVVDGVILGMVWPWVWPFVKKHWQHHVDRDKRDKV